MKILTKGLSASPGKAKGKVTIVNSLATISDFPKGNVLVVPFTTPLLTIAMINAAAIVTERGGVTSHCATVAREIGIPCVVRAKNATLIMKDGMEVLVDGDKGCVYELSLR